MAVNSVQYNTIPKSGIESTNRNKNDLTMDDFFKLIAAQLQNQDMFNPVDNTEFIAQMAQISTLSQMNELSNNMNTNLSVSMLGKTVSAQTPDARGNLQTITGPVEGVTFSNGRAVVQVGGQYFGLEQIVQITNSGTNAESSEE